MLLSQANQSINKQIFSFSKITVALFFRQEPSDIQFSNMKTDERSNLGETTVSVIVGKKTLYLYNINEPDNPIELAFQSRYSFESLVNTVYVPYIHGHTYPCLAVHT